ncbi:MAG: hypothetical protein JWM43_2074 [Acidobacteriaceae bacterium]|nr:hypothetical protein [Acidobacteriaceae bacterium]
MISNTLPLPNSVQKSHRRTPAQAVISSLTAIALGLALTVGTTGCKSAAPAADDASLSTALHARISGDSAIAAEPIQISVENGIATLNGTVSNDAARSLAANDAAQVPGIRTVVNNLTVQQAAATPPPVIAPAPVTPVRPAPAPVRPPVVKKPKVVRDTQPQISQYGPPSTAPAPIDRPTPAPVAVAPPPPPPPAFRNVTLSSGSTIPVRITQTLDSATTQQGETFAGVVATDVIIDGLVAIPQGTPITGRVSEVHEAAHFKGSSLLTVELTNINRKGERIPVTTEPFTKEGAGRGKNTAAKVGGGAAVGAILGGIFGGGKGAAIGAASGGALGAGANTVTKGQQVQIPSETLIRFRLSNSVAIRASTRDAGSRDTSEPESDTRRRPLDPNNQQ